VVAEDAAYLSQVVQGQRADLRTRTSQRRCPADRFARERIVADCEVEDLTEYDAAMAATRNTPLGLGVEEAVEGADRRDAEVVGQLLDRQQPFKSGPSAVRGG
jgi:hypothetical protein